VRFFFAFVLLLQTLCFGQSESWKQRVNQVLSTTLERYHYIDQPIDDNFSKRVFQLFMNQIDPNKQFFTKNQVVELTAYEYKIDNDIRNNTFHFYNLCILRLNEQIDLTQSIYNTILKLDIDLTAPNAIEFDIEKKDYAQNNSELTKRWKAKMQHQIGQNYIALFKEKYPSENTLRQDDQLELEARMKTKKDMDRQFKRLIEKKNEDYFSSYLNAIAMSFGPHTTYLPPAEKEDFDINMTGKLEGIGAVLRETDGVIKVVQIIPGSASWRQGELKAEDTILKVSQENGELVSIIETPVKDAVKLIRGPKGSTVNLTVKKPNGIIKTIAIKRDIVIIKSAYAKTGTFKVLDSTFGYINLPSFYRDFENNNSQNAADDIKKALIELNKQNSHGLILDLRNNGGGSLKDAVDISGFFISQGPIVQVSDGTRRKDIYEDTDNQIIYKEPLIILVNKFSASASEIVAAALQDYNRAIIMGDHHTFGKGTVQKVVNLDHVILRKTAPLGYIKITIQEYFRINGTSTQFNGVTPDIIYPSTVDYLDVGEKDLKFAFKGSSLTPADYTQWPSIPEKSQIFKNASRRLQTNPSVNQINSYNDFMKQQTETSIRSVKLSDLWNNMALIKDKNESISTLSVTKAFTDYQTIEPQLNDMVDNDKDDFDKWVSSFNDDLLLNEALTVLSDIHRAQN
jgi:carboxyl-terminal processing protease